MTSSHVYSVGDTVQATLVGTVENGGRNGNLLVQVRGIKPVSVWIREADVKKIRPFPNDYGTVLIEKSTQEVRYVKTTIGWLYLPKNHADSTMYEVRERTPREAWERGELVEGKS